MKGHMFEKRVVGPGWAERCLAEGAISPPYGDEVIALPQ